MQNKGRFTNYIGKAKTTKRRLLSSFISRVPSFLPLSKTEEKREDEKEEINWTLQTETRTTAVEEEEEGGESGDCSSADGEQKVLPPGLVVANATGSWLKVKTDSLLSDRPTSVFLKINAFFQSHIPELSSSSKDSCPEISVEDVMEFCARRTKRRKGEEDDEDEVYVEV